MYRIFNSGKPKIQVSHFGQPEDLVYKLPAEHVMSDLAQ
jgi:hypothetical protein